MISEIKVDQDVNDWDVADFIYKNGGLYTEFDDHFSIWIDNDKPNMNFKNGDTICYDKESKKFTIK